MFSSTRASVTQVVRSQGFKRYFNNTSWLLGERVVSMGVAFVISALIARHLGAEQMGILAYGISIVGFMDIFIIMGLESTLTRNLVQEPEKSHTILGSALGIRLGGSILALLMLAGVILFTPADKQTVAILLILAIGSLIKGGQIFYNVFESQVITKYDARIKLVSLTLTSIFRLVLIYIFASTVTWFAWAYVITEAVNITGQIWIYRRKRLGRIRAWNFNRAYAKRLLNDSWPLIFSSLLAGFYMRIDQVMIKHMLDDTETGIYYTAVRFSTIFFFVPILITNSVSPAIYEAKKKSEAFYHKRLSQLMSLVVGATYLIVIGVSLVGQPLVDWIYGEEYTRAGGVIVVHVWSLLFVALGGVSTTYLLAEHLEKLRLYRTMVGAAINIGLNFWMIPRYGIMGAAYATLVSQAAASYFTYVFSKKTHRIFWIQTRAIFLLDPLKSLLAAAKK